MAEGELTAVLLTTEVRIGDEVVLVLVERAPVVGIDCPGETVDVVEASVVLVVLELGGPERLTEALRQIRSVQP